MVTNGRDVQEISKYQGWYWFSEDLRIIKPSCLRLENAFATFNIRKFLDVEETRLRDRNIKFHHELATISRFLWRTNLFPMFPTEGVSKGHVCIRDKLRITFVPCTIYSLLIPISVSTNKEMFCVSLY